MFRMVAASIPFSAISLAVASIIFTAKEVWGVGKDVMACDKEEGLYGVATALKGGDLTFRREGGQI